MKALLISSLLVSALAFAEENGWYKYRPAVANGSYTISIDFQAPSNRSAENHYVKVAKIYVNITPQNGARPKKVEGTLLQHQLIDSGANKYGDSKRTLTFHWDQDHYWAEIGPVTLQNYSAAHENFELIVDGEPLRDNETGSPYFRKNLLNVR